VLARCVSTEITERGASLRYKFALIEIVCIVASSGFGRGFEYDRYAVHWS
jgi:hypothetical protein